MTPERHSQIQRAVATRKLVYRRLPAVGEVSLSPAAVEALRDCLEHIACLEAKLSTLRFICTDNPRCYVLPPMETIP